MLHSTFWQHFLIQVSKSSTFPASKNFPDLIPYRKDALKKRTFLHNVSFLSVTLVSLVRVWLNIKESFPYVMLTGEDARWGKSDVVEFKDWTGFIVAGLVVVKGLSLEIEVVLSPFT